MAATHHLIGIAFVGLGDLPAALSNFDEAIRLHEAMLAADSQDARARSLLADNYAEQSTALLQAGRKQAGLTSIRRALSLQQQSMSVDGKEVPARLSMADYESRLASTYAALGKPHDAGKTWATAVLLYSELDREGHLRLRDAHDDAQHARSEAARYSATNNRVRYRTRIGNCRLAIRHSTRGYSLEVTDG